MGIILITTCLPAETELEGTTVVIYTMGLTKWIYVPGKDIAIKFQALKHCCKDNWALQKGILLDCGCPPISPFCIKERYENALFTATADGFTLTHPNLGHLMISPLSLMADLSLLTKQLRPFLRSIVLSLSP